MSQLVVSISIAPGQPYEDASVRSPIDQHYLRHPKRKGLRRQSCDTVAKTIFPYTLVHPGQDRADLYRTFLKIMPQLKRCPANRRGMYFERMIGYAPHGGQRPGRTCPKRRTFPTSRRTRKRSKPSRQKCKVLRTSSSPSTSLRR